VQGGERPAGAVAVPRGPRPPRADRSGPRRCGALSRGPASRVEFARSGGHGVGALTDCESTIPAEGSALRTSRLLRTFSRRGRGDCPACHRRASRGSSRRWTATEEVPRQDPSGSAGTHVVEDRVDDFAWSGSAARARFSVQINAGPSRKFTDEGSGLHIHRIPPIWSDICRQGRERCNSSPARPSRNVVPRRPSSALTTPDKGGPP